MVCIADAEQYPPASKPAYTRSRASNTWRRFIHRFNTTVMIPAFYLGIDISAETFCARLADADGNPLDAASRSFANSAEGYAELLAFVSASGVQPSAVHVVMEATGVYWEALALWLAEQGIRLSVVNPLQIKSFAKTRLQRNKTDDLDAELIARFGATLKPQLWSPPEIEADELQIVMRQRDAYVGMLTQERNRLHALKRRPRCPPSLLTMSQAMIGSLQTAIATLDADIKQRLQQTDAWKEAYDLITSVVGIGVVTAGVILSETNCFASIHAPEQFVAYAGLAPVVFSSGTSVNRGAHISHFCSHRLRKALFLAAVSAIRSDKAPFRDFYQNLRRRGKPAKLALIAVAHKLARVIAAVLLTKKPFQNNYCRPACNIL